jgi:hypothetical protein
LGPGLAIPLFFFNSSYPSAFPKNTREIFSGFTSSQNLLLLQYKFIKAISTITSKKGQNKKITILLSYSVLLPERFFLRN